MIRDDNGVVRSKAGERLVFCRYSIEASAPEIPAEAADWFNRVRHNGPDPKQTPEYKVLQDYAEKAIRFECLDLTS